MRNWKTVQVYFQAVKLLVMKHKLIFLFFLNLCLISCNKDNNSEKYGYPEGIKVIDLESISDCFLPECSPERVVRLIAQSVKGKIFKGINTGRYGVSYSFSFDSSVRFYFCDLPEEFKHEDLLVLFSGELIDACGVIEAIWPVEETYLIKLFKIENQ